MVARQLPKLKTRVRFPSPAPKIQPTLVVGFIFGDAASEENPTELPTATRGFGTKRSVVKGAHGVKTNMGIYSPLPRPPKINGHECGRFVIGVASLL